MHILRKITGRFILLTALVCSTFWATIALADQAQFYGTWGTQNHCSRNLIIRGGTKRWAPFEIDADWLRYGDVWCRLNWVHASVSQESASGLAEALCGEDDNRDYRILFYLVDGQLSIQWSSEYENSGLRRCSS